MYRHKRTLEPLTVSPEGAYFLGVARVGEPLVEEVCDHCEEPGDDVDRLGSFRDPAYPASQFTAHDLCADGEGWVLA